MKRLFFALCFCSVCFYAYTQNNKVLRIGDTLPAITVTVLSGDGVLNIPLASFYKDKPVILDFWATWCGSCVKTMAEADSLIKRSGNGFGLVPISYEDRKTVGAFVKKNKVMQKLPFIYAVEDSVLMGRMISFRELPHEVWVGKDGVIKAITYAEELTTENTEAFIKKEVLYLPEKNDLVDFDLTKPLPVDPKEILYRSVLTPYKRGIIPAIGSFGDSYNVYSTIDRFFANNKSILDMFYAAYSENKGLIKKDRIELYVRDSLSLNPFELLRKGTIKQKIPYLYCYEKIVPKKLPAGVFYRGVMNDLNQLFPYYASIEKRKVICWVLINREAKKNPNTMGSISEIKWESGFFKRLTNQYMNVLVDYLNWNMNLPVVDESGFLNPFDMELDIGAVLQDNRIVLNTEKVQQSLQKYGFDLVKGERMIDILVIREKKE